jgi:hypothetical protein
MNLSDGSILGRQAPLLDIRSPGEDQVSSLHPSPIEELLLVSEKCWPELGPASHIILTKGMTIQIAESRQGSIELVLWSGQWGRSGWMDSGGECHKCLP